MQHEALFMGTRAQTEAVASASAGVRAELSAEADADVRAARHAAPDAGISAPAGLRAGVAVEVGARGGAEMSTAASARASAAIFDGASTPVPAETQTAYAAAAAAKAPVGVQRGAGQDHPRELPLRRVRNVRDLGGYAYVAEDGTRGLTAYGLLLRAPSLRSLRQDGFAYLADYGCGGLQRVVDLRSDFEVRHWPDPYAGGRDGVAYTHVPMLDQLNSGGFREALPDRMFTVYKSLLDNEGASIRRVFEALAGAVNGAVADASAAGCALFHCRAGKDRTGVIAMLLLGLAGVADEDIVHDYAATQRFLGRGLRAQRIAVSVLLRRRAPRCLFEAIPEEMELTLAHLHACYGSARTYLREVAGCSEELLACLTARLRGEAAPRLA